MSARKMMLALVFLSASGGFAFRAGERQAQAVSCAKPECTLVHAWWTTEVENQKAGGCWTVHNPGTLVTEATEKTTGANHALTYPWTSFAALGPWYKTSNPQIAKIVFTSRQWDCDNAGSGQLRTCNAKGVSHVSAGDIDQAWCKAVGGD